MRIPGTISAIVLTTTVLLVSDCKRFEPEGFLVVSTDAVEIARPGVYLFKGSIPEMGMDPIRQHGFCWSTSRNPTVNNTLTRLGERNAPGLISSEVSTLVPGSSYYIRAYAVTGSETLYGEELQFRALNFTPEVETREVKNIGSTDAQVVAMVSIDQGVDIDQKGICYKPAHVSTGPASLENPFTEEGPGAGEFTSNLEGLDCNTRYFLNAYAIVAGVVTYGNTLDFTTDGCGVPVVGTFVVHSVTAHSARIGGTVYEEGAGPVTSKGVFYGTNPEPSAGGAHIELGEGASEFEVLIGDLEPSTVYYYQAYAVNSHGTGFGEISEFITKEHGPGDEVAFAAVQWLEEWEKEPANEELKGYNNHSYPRAWYAARRVPEGWKYESIVDAATFDANWDQMWDMNHLANRVSHELAGDPYDLDTDNPTFGFGWKAVHDGNKLYIFLRAIDLDALMDEGSFVFEIQDQPTSIFRHEATFAAAQDSGGNRVAYENMAYARYLELGGGLSTFRDGNVERYDASVGLDRLDAGRPYFNGGWGSNNRGLEALQNENHFWLNDGAGTIRAVYVMPFDGVLSYPADPTNPGGEWLRVQPMEIISFDIKGMAVLKGGSGWESTVSYFWSANHSHCWASNYYAGKLLIYDQVTDLPVLK